VLSVVRMKMFSISTSSLVVEFGGQPCQLAVLVIRVVLSAKKG
jgi:hypothetical protein